MFLAGTDNNSISIDRQTGGGDPPVKLSICMQVIHLRFASIWILFVFIFLFLFPSLHLPVFPLMPPSCQWIGGFVILFVVVEAIHKVCYIITPGGYEERST